jgi:uncharacterized protein (DUF885 family)
MLIPILSGAQMKTLAMLFLVAFFSVPAVARADAGKATAAPADVDARRQSLNDLLKEQWEYVLETNPIFASIIGDKRWNDKVGDESLAFIKKDYAKSREFLKRFEAIDTTGFPEQEQLNKTLMVLNLKNDIEGERFESYLMPVNQMSGLHLEAPQVTSLLPFATVKDYDDFIKRLKQLPTTFDQNIERMRLGMGKRLMPPKFLLEKVAAQAQGIAKTPAEKSPFAQPLAKMPKEFSETDQKRIRQELLNAVREHVLPAYAKFAAFVEKEYAPRGRTEVGVWSLPDGEARYARAVRLSTTTDMTPEQIHQLGLREVQRLGTEMLAIAKKLGYRDLKSFNAAVAQKKELHPTSRQHILDVYRDHIGDMEKVLPRLFGRLPKAKLEVLPVEEFREKEFAAAQYMLPSPDGTRPGRVMVNTYKADERTLLDMEATAYHEGHPGHHLQIAIQQELPALPPFRQHGGYGAFSEGWALYSERLGKEVGFYRDPYSDYGRLQSEMLRAIRLVVDTGLHHKRWTREQVVQFFRDHSSTDEVDIQNETDRYIVWPGQALAYKVGQLKILEARERAKQKLGDRFRITEFHDEVLGAGALPLNVLEDRINSWIAEKSRSAAN